MAGNLFENLPDDCPQEIFESLARSGAVRIERIISAGHASPPGFWYDQDEHEFVLVLQGHAVIGLPDGSRIELNPGSWLHLPAHQKHRVLATAHDQPTVWLAVFWKTVTSPSS
jgi:cupin 2 domain-containing protein